MDVKIVLFVISLAFGNVVALRCYACSFSSSDSDKSCEEITESTNTVNCPFTYCTIYRQEYVDPVGVIASFERGCQLRPDFLNHDIQDSTFRTFYRACTSDLCNNGDGVQSVTGGQLAAVPEYDGENILIRGTGQRNFANFMKLNVVILLLSVLLVGIN